MLGDLCHESNELIIAGESRSGIRAHCGDGTSGVQISGTGALCRCHDLGLQRLHTAAIIHHKIEAGSCAGHLIGQPNELVEPSTSSQSGHNALDLTQQATSSVGATTEPTVEVFLLFCCPAVALRHFLDFGICSHKLRACLCNLCGIDSPPRGPLDLLKGIESGVQCGGNPPEHYAHFVIESHLRSDSCHGFTTFGTKAPALIAEGGGAFTLFSLCFTCLAFELRLFFLFRLTADVNGGDYKSTLFDRET